MQIQMKPVKTYEAVGPNGHKVALTQVGAEWNSLLEFQDPAGRKLILMHSSSPVSKMLSEIMGTESLDEWTVVVGSPGLVHDLGLLTHKRKQSAP